MEAPLNNGGGVMFTFEHDGDDGETIRIETETFAKIAAIQAFCEFMEEHGWDASFSLEALTEEEEDEEWEEEEESEEDEGTQE